MPWKGSGLLLPFIHSSTLLYLKVDFLLLTQYQRGLEESQVHYRMPNLLDINVDGGGRVAHFNFFISCLFLFPSSLRLNIFHIFLSWSLTHMNFYNVCRTEGCNSSD